MVEPTVVIAAEEANGLFWIKSGIACRNDKREDYECGVPSCSDRGNRPRNSGHGAGHMLPNDRVERPVAMPTRRNTTRHDFSRSAPMCSEVSFKDVSVLIDANGGSREKRFLPVKFASGSKVPLFDAPTLSSCVNVNRVTKQIAIFSD
jgi:hypothetical protein